MQPFYQRSDGERRINYEIDRVQIVHPAKPEPAVIQKLKSNGFKWSPTAKAWQRKITGNALYATAELTGLKATA